MTPRSARPPAGEGRPTRRTGSGARSSHQTLRDEFADEVGDRRAVQARRLGERRARQRSVEVHEAQDRERDCACRTAVVRRFDSRRHMEGGAALCPRTERRFTSTWPRSGERWTRHPICYRLSYSNNSREGASCPPPPPPTNSRSDSGPSATTAPIRSVAPPVTRSTSCTPSRSSPSSAPTASPSTTTTCSPSARPMPSARSRSTASRARSPTPA